jgi:Zn-dependent metalloprotease
MLMSIFSSNFIFGQETEYYSPSNCENYNSFAKTAQIEQVKPLVASVMPNGVIYLDPEKEGNFETILQEMGVDVGTTFEFVRETKSRLDNTRFYQKFKQLYNGVEVQGGGYTIEYIGTGGPVNPCGGVAYLFAPHILNNINLSTRPMVESTAIPRILGVDKTQKPLLIITHNLNNQCKYNLTWEVIYELEGKPTISWVDALSGNILNTIDVTMNHNAPTETYGSQDLLDKEGVLTTLESPDSRVVMYDFGATCPSSVLDENQWTSTLIPQTSNQTKWTTEADPKTFQAFWVTSQVVPLYEGIDINFEKISVANCDEETAFSLTGSTTQKAFIALGNIGGSTTAIFDVIAHELGHTYLNQFLGYSSTGGNRTLHEGISDILGTYIESLVPSNNGVDWVMGDDEPNVANCTCVDRDFENPRFSCLTTATFEHHERGMVLGHWFYLISKGRQSNSIPAIGLQKSLDILLESLTLLGENAGPQELMQSTLTTVLDKYGRCSDEFLAIARAWELICVPTGYTNSLGVVPPCSLSICGENSVCEESDYLKLCACGVYPAGTKFRWTIIGKKSTEYRSEYGMQGNGQNGGNCLTLIDFPKYPYYPQTITIELYSPTLGVQYIKRKTIKLIDCNGDDPTCEEYYDFNGNPSEERFSFSNNSLNGLEKINDKYQYVKVFDIYGKLLAEGLPENISFDKIPSNSVHILTFYNSEGQIMEVKKLLKID